MRQAGSVWQIGVRFILVVWFRMTAAAAARFFLEGVYINAIINCLLDEGSLRREPAGVIISTRGRRNKWGKVSSGWRNFLYLLHRRCHLAVKKSGFLFDSMSFRYDKETTITWKTRKNFSDKTDNRILNENLWSSTECYVYTFFFTLDSTQIMFKRTVGILLFQSWWLKWL